MYSIITPLSLMNACERCTGCYPSRTNQKYPAASRICEHMCVSGSKKSAIFVRSCRVLLVIRVRDLTTGTVILETPTYVRRYWRLNEHRRQLAVAQMSIVHNDDQQTRSSSTINCVHIDRSVEDLNTVLSYGMIEAKRILINIINIIWIFILYI